MRRLARIPAGTVLRAAFVLLAVGAAAWTVRHDVDTLPAALRQIGPVRSAAAALLVLAGIWCTADCWRACLSALGYPIGRGAARRVFFPAQVGKYLPGAVWPFVMQAQLARRHEVPVRVTVAAGTLFLVVHASTGAALGLLLLPASTAVAGADVWWLPVVAVAAVALLNPRVLGWLTSRLGPDTGGRRLRWADVLRPVAWMAPTWACFGLAAALLLGPLSPAERAADLLLLSAGAFAAAWVIGLAVVIAPAGLGAREAVLVVAFGPLVGVASATLVAVLLRICHIAADVTLAAGYGATKHGRAPAGRGEPAVRPECHPPTG